MKLCFELESFPFDEGFLPPKTERSLTSLPFILESDPHSVLHQRLEPKARELLHAYYAKGGYGSTPLGEGEFATRQGEEVFRAIDEALKAVGKRWQDSDVLEIGSSYGYLLQCAREAGARSVLGVEPGDEGNIGSKKYDIPYLQDFFPTPRLTQTFDVIYTHCVLEHIEDLQPFVTAMADHLRPGGLLFVAVPECEKKLRVGDISIISHQHVNYFTEESLGRMLVRSGLGSITTVSSTERAILYGWAVKSGEAAGRAFAEDANEGVDVLLEFIRAYRLNISVLSRLIRETRDAGGTIGFYGISPVLGGILAAEAGPLRLFDGDRAKHGKFIAGCDSPVESPEELVKHPVDRLLVCPIDYDREIRSWLTDQGFPADRVISLLEVFEQSAGHSY